MESYILFWFVSEWGFLGLKIGICGRYVLWWRGLLFFVLVCYGCSVFFMGNFSCLCDYLGSYDYLFLLILLFFVV